MSRCGPSLKDHMNVISEARLGSSNVGVIQPMDRILLCQTTGGLVQRRETTFINVIGRMYVLFKQVSLQNKSYLFKIYVVAESREK